MNLKITIPDPCNENWDKMTPKDNGRFCLSCSKTVVDFSSMLPEKIQHFFIQNQNEKICGRFKESQLDLITIQIPSRVLSTQTNYHKIFLLALFVVMGTTLFSCADKDGNKKKIDKIEVTNDESKFDSPIGKAIISKNDSTCEIVSPPPPPPSKTHDSVKNSEKYEKRVSGEIILEKQKKSAKSPKNIKQDKKLSTNTTKEDESQYLTGAVMQTNAEFPGGIEQFYNFFAQEFNAPENIYTKNLKIRISFAVEKDGSMHYMQSEPAIDQRLEQEIIRVLKVSPKWQAGQLSGKKIRMQYSLPITF